MIRPLLIFAALFWACFGRVACERPNLEPSVANGASSDSRGATAFCRKITNACGQTIMVPSKVDR